MTKKINHLTRTNRLRSAFAPLAAVLAAFTVQSAIAANGPAYYFDVDDTTPGFGSPAGNYNFDGTFWSTNSDGTETTVTIPALSQMTFGVSETDFSGNDFTINFNVTRNWAGLLVNGTNVNITLSGNANTYINAVSTWTVPAGSTVTSSNPRQQFDDGSTVALRGINWNNKAVTFNGGGTITFLTPLGCNSTALNTQNMPGGTVNIQIADNTPVGLGRYKGGYTLQDGTLNFASAGAANIFYGFTAGKLFTINGGTIDNTSGSEVTLNFSGGGGVGIGGDFTFTGTSDLDLGTADVALTASPTITVNAGTLTIGGAISGAFGLTKAGAGTLALMGTNSYTGSTIVTGGTLALGATNSIPTSTDVNLADATLVVGFPTAAGAVTAGTLTVGGATNVVSVASLAPGFAYPVQLTAIKYTSLSGAFNFGLGSLPPSPGTPYTGFISNNVANLSVDVVITGGPVPARDLFWSGATDSNWDTFTANWVHTNSATTYNNLDFVTFDDTATGTTEVNFTTTLTPASLTVSNQTKNYGFTGGGNLSGATGITKDGAGTLYITNSGFNDYTGGLTILAGTVRVGEGTFSGNLGTGAIANNGALIFNRADAVTVAEVISGSGNLTKQGSGSLTLSGANTYDGATTVQTGTLIPGHTSALGSTNGATTVNSGATLDVNGSNLGAEPVSVSGVGGGSGAIVNSGAGQNNALRYVTLQGNTTFGGAARWDIRSTSTGDASLSGLSTGGNPYKLTKIGVNQVSLVGTTVDPALGDVDVQQGIFSIETATTGLGNAASNVTVAAGATLQFFALTNQLNKVISLASDGFAASLNNASGANTILGPVTLVNDCIFNVGGTSLSLNGSLTGGALTRTTTGFGNLILNGNATHTSTTSDVGKLTLNGTHTGPINCPSSFSPSFAGSGTNLGFTTVGGPVFPGDTNVVGTLTLSGLTLDFGASLFVDLGPTTTVGMGSNDLVQVNGDLTVNFNTITVNPQGLLIEGAGNPYTIIKYTGNLIWNGDLTASGPNNYTFTVDTNTVGEIRLVAAGGPPVWDGGSATVNNWTDADNWGGVTLNFGDTLFFAGVTRLNNTNDTADATTYNGMTFDASAGPFILNGNSVTLAAGIVNNSTNTQTVNLPLNYNDSRTFDGAMGSLAIAGDVTNSAASGTQVLTFSGIGSVANTFGTAGGRTSFLTTSNADWSVLDNALSTPVTLPGQLFVYNGGTWTFGSVSSAPNLTLTGADGTGAERHGVGNGTGTSVMNMVNGTLTLQTRLSVGNGTAGAILNVSGGTLSVGGAFQIADNNIATIGEVNMDGGSLIISNNVFVSRGEGTFNMNGGTFDAAGFYELARNIGGQTPNGVINLNGGTFAVNDIRSSSTVAGSSANLNFNGGVLKARQDNASFIGTGSAAPIIATVQAGGAIIDTAGFNVSNLVSLVHDSALGATPDGGLTKNGAGALTLTATNTYTGDTTVNAGTLVLVEPTVDTNSTVSVTNGATLQLGFAVTNTVAGLVLNGVSQSPGVYNNSTSPSFITGTGSLLVAGVGPVVPSPALLTNSVAGGNLVLSWPAGEGWSLQVQTNLLNKGLSTNWTTISGSQSISSTNIPLDKTSPTIFYRLVYP